jgi:RNA polymerase sigma factor (sigma-70 family)
LCVYVIIDLALMSDRTSDRGSTIRSQAAIPRAESHDVERPDRTPGADRDAFEQFVADHYASVRRLVFRLLGWRDGGEDVVQEVFLAAWAGWRRLRRETSAEFWLKRIAVNKCRSRLRREAVRARWLRWIVRAPPEEPKTADDDSLAGEERAERVRRAINALGPRYREVTVLFYLEEMTVEQIAQLTNTRRNTVEVRLHRARRQLAEHLADLADHLGVNSCAR